MTFSEKIANCQTVTDLANLIVEVHGSKNTDYGATWDYVLDAMGTPRHQTIWSRMADKWCRITNLFRKLRDSGSGPLVKEESVEDTLMDLAVYSLICIIQYRRDREDAKQGFAFDNSPKPVLDFDRVVAAAKAINKI